MRPGSAPKSATTWQGWPWATNTMGEASLRTAVTVRAGRRTRLLRVGALSLLALLAVYLVASAYLARTIWSATRHSLHTTPAQYGLQYEDVSFPSAVDNIPLKGWLMGKPGAKTILV